MFLVCAGVSLCYGEEDYIYFIYTTLINMAVGSGLILLGRGAENRVTRRDGYCIVAFTWLLFTAFGMLPFYISGSIPSVADAFLRRCPALPLRGQPFWMTLNRFHTACCSGEVSHNGLEDWESFSLRLPCCLSSEWAIRCFSRQRLRGDARQDSSENQCHGPVAVDGISHADFGGNRVAADRGMDLFDAVCHAFSTTATGDILPSRTAWHTGTRLL